MQREEFIRRYDATKQTEKLTPDNCYQLVMEYLKVSDPSVLAIDNDDEQKASTQVNNNLKYVIMEELAELSQQVSKDLRGKGDKVCILEELADVAINVKIAQKLYGISDEKLERAMTVKLERTRRI